MAELEKLNILVLDDNQLCGKKILFFLESLDVSSSFYSSPADALVHLNNHKTDIVFCDFMMPEMDGLRVLQIIKKKFPKTEVIVMSEFGDMDTVIEALRLGAIDYIKKPVQAEDIRLAVERTGKCIMMLNELSKLEYQKSLISKQLEELIHMDFIGVSQAIQEVRDLAFFAAKDKDVTVMITGENGTGKEIIARIIHFSSERSKEVFYPLNSAAIPHTLLESEFFGHVKGSFTDAIESKKGCFELANGGTLFLDEISEMPASLQPKLLRALEEKQIKPIGSSKQIDVELRIISASNKPLKRLLKGKNLRLDLFHRLNTFMIHIPPLRERKEDIEPLLLHFASQIAKNKNIKPPEIQKGLVHHLKNYHFPGNVRELRNMVERAMILSEGKKLTMENFPTHNFRNVCKQVYIQNLNLATNEKHLILSALKKASYNQSKAARLLGISRDALIRKKKKYEIQIAHSVDLFTHTQNRTTGLF
jgi:DNA-binding NtrC family response regulator